MLPGVPHHVWLRGNNRRRLFSWKWEYRLFLRLVDEARRKYGCLIHALVLMVNHIHMLMTPPSKEDGSAFIGNVSQRYAQRRNQLRHGSGKLFEQRFEAEPVTDAAYLATVTAYIELNPVAAGICDDPSQYRWSTHGLHIGRPELSEVPLELWTPSDWYDGLGDTVVERADRYAEWVEQRRALAELKMAAERELRIRRPDETRAT